MQNLRARIQQYGPLPFSDYMEYCLFNAESGYYSGLQAIGRGGDFTTAPECGPYLAYALAHYCVQRLPRFQSEWSVLELGAGTGRLAHDLLQAFSHFNQLPQYYYIVEKSPALRASQEKTLQTLSPDLFRRMQWLDHFEPASLQGFLLGNEVLDALPVERFIKTERGLRRLGVGLEGESLEEVPLDEFLIPPVGAQDLLAKLPEGYRSEINFNLSPFLERFLPAFSQGEAILIDYGYEREEYYQVARREGTVLAYFKHHVLSPFEKPGQCDITAHLDFTAVAEVFMQAGWQVEGLLPQGQFLLEQGVLNAYPLNAEHYALRRLLDPRLMGEIFKVFLARFPYS